MDTNGETIERVDSFGYSGDMVNEEGGIDENRERRIWAKKEPLQTSDTCGMKIRMFESKVSLCLYLDARLGKTPKP